jgi:hypothetical protein
MQVYHQGLLSFMLWETERIGLLRQESELLQGVSLSLTLSKPVNFDKDSVVPKLAEKLGGLT